MRALAIGGGKAGGDIGGSNSMVAQLVNLQLQRAHFATLTAEEGVECIVKILKGYNMTSTDEGVDSDASRLPSPLVPEDCELEIAISTKLGGMQRLRLSPLGAA